MTDGALNERILKLAHRIEQLHNYQFNMDVAWVHWPRSGGNTTMCGCIGGWAIYLNGARPNRKTLVPDFMRVMNLPAASLADVKQLLLPQSDKENKYWPVGEARTRLRGVEALRKFAADYPEKKLGAR